MASDSFQKLIARGRVVPALPAAGRVARAGGGQPSQAVCRRALLGQARAEFWRPRRAAGGRRPGAGGPGRQPHRPHLHRRSLRRLAVRGAAPGRLRQPAGVGRSRRRPGADRRLGDGDRPLRAARQPADDRGARQLHSVFRARAGAVEAQARAAGTGRFRMGRDPAGAAQRSVSRRRSPSRASATGSRSRSAPTRCSAASTSASRTRSPAG